LPLPTTLFGDCKGKRLGFTDGWSDAVQSLLLTPTINIYMQAITQTRKRNFRARHDRWRRYMRSPIFTNMSPMTEHFQRFSSSGRRWPQVLAILILGFGLRAWGLPDQSLSMDEVVELRNAARGLTEIVRTADGFPPLYNLLLHGWLDLFADGLAARWLSLLCGVVSIHFGWLLGRRIDGDAVGLWTALFLAVSPLYIWYSQEGRAYALYLLLATVALWALLRALERDSLEDWILYAAVATAGMYVHYYFVVVVIVGAIIILHERHGPHEFAKPIVAYSALSMLCLPLLWLLPPDLGLQAGPEYASQTRFGIDALGYTYVSLVTGYTLGPSLRELHTMSPAEAFAGFLPWLALIAPPVAILGYQGWRVLGRRALERLVLLIVAPVAITGILGLLAGVGYNVRYVVWVAVPVGVLLAAGATQWRRWLVGASLVVLLGLFGMALANRHLSDRYRNEDMRALSAYLGSQPETGVPIFVLSGYMAAPLQYYMGPEHAIYSLRGSPQDTSGAFQALQLIESRITAGKPYWLVYSREFHGDPRGSVREALQQRDSLRVIARFAGVVLYRGVTPAKGSQNSPDVRSRQQRSAS
jgi:dolichyl-phosphate-mannose-protein mannosyltransferase